MDTSNIKTHYRIATLQRIWLQLINDSNHIYILYTYQLITETFKTYATISRLTSNNLIQFALLEIINGTVMN